MISGKQEHVMTEKKSGSFYSINCYITQVAVTEAPKFETPGFPEDAKYGTEVYLCYQRFRHLASKWITSMSQRTRRRILESLLFALDVYLESLIGNHSVLLLRKLGQYVKKSTWISKDMVSIGKHLSFLILVDDYSGLTVAYSMQQKSDALKRYRGFPEPA